MSHFRISSILWTASLLPSRRMISDSLVLPRFGGFNICFTVGCSFFNNPTDGFEFIEFVQMYAGSEFAPTMIDGTFGPRIVDVFVNSNQYDEKFQKVLAVATPEPSTIPALGAGILWGLAGLLLRRRT
jgi:hypothetical protein